MNAWDYDGDQCWREEGRKKKKEEERKERMG